MAGIQPLSFYSVAPPSSFPGSQSRRGDLKGMLVGGDFQGLGLEMRRFLIPHWLDPNLVPMRESQRRQRGVKELCAGLAESLPSPELLTLPTASSADASPGRLFCVGRLSCSAHFPAPGGIIARRHLHADFECGRSSLGHSLSQEVF